MSIKYRVIRFLVVLCLSTISYSQEKPIKIACVGNSITYGAGMVNRELNAYPVQLQSLLGSKYQVKNFGVNGRTLLKKGDLPYWNTSQYKEALAYTPDIVFIKLGTNDSKGQNRAHLNSDFVKDYKELIHSFKLANKGVRIVLLLPAPSFSTDTTKIWNPIIKEQIIPLTQLVAYETESEVLDLYQLFVNATHLFPDKIHPSSLGATRIAKRLYESVITPKEVGVKVLAHLDIKVAAPLNFHGFQQENFKWNGTIAKLIKPKIVAKGNPWVLRARFWGHEPQTDIALLERGFHIAYCDVANLFGSAKAVERWNDFYDLMIKGGLSKKVVLEGMSRGGLIIYNWAVKNPDKVACIYADAPVLDGKSWPGGKGDGKYSEGDWNNFKTVYHIENDQDLANFKGNPIHKTKEIASGGYPMMHVVGETDEVVPIAENTVPFEKAILAAGGDINVIYKAKNGHHPHSLKNPTPIVDFILRATHRKINFAKISAPSAEYRAGAGWTKKSDWHDQARDIDSICRATTNADLLLIGNSITQSWGGNRTLINSYTGAEAAKVYFKDKIWLNAGISGDKTQQILWRLQNGQYEKSKPKTVVLMIGVNNFPTETAQEIVQGIKEIVKLSEAKFKNSNIMLFGPLPTGIDPNTKRRAKYNRIHQLLSTIKLDQRVTYHRLDDLFMDDKGQLKDRYYSGDGIHLKPAAYEVWAKYILVFN